MSESIFNPTKGMSNASLETKETNLVVTEERVIMQTTTIDLENGKDEENGIKLFESFQIAEVKEHIYQRALLKN